MKLVDHDMPFVAPVIFAVFAYFVADGLLRKRVGRTLFLPEYRRDASPLGYYVSMAFLTFMCLLGAYDTVRYWLF